MKTQSLLLLLSAVLSQNVLASAPIESVYTKLSDCIEIASSEYDEPMEIDHFTTVCKGFVGYSVVYHGGDARSSIALRYNGSGAQETLSETPEGFGTFINIAGDRIEWRGTRVNGKFTPSAIIYRLSAQDYDQPGKTNHGLIVVRITKKGTCQQAFVLKNSTARKAADLAVRGKGCTAETYPTSTGEE